MATHILGYDSAIEVFRRAGERLAGRPRELVSLRACGVPDQDFGEGEICRWLGGESPAHVLVATAADSRRRSRVVTHVWGARDDEWPVIALADGVFVSSPEFVFLQMANVLDELELTFLGYELCGCYGYGGGHIVKRAQLTTPEAIGEFLACHVGARGRERAMRALGNVLGGSGSPMETELVMRLCLPRKKGGRGIVAPGLNAEVALGHVARSAVGFDTIRPDVSWLAAGLVLEYDSDERHTGTDRIAGDARRRLAYDSMGLRVITVTNDMLQRSDGFEALVRTVGKATGKHLRSAGYDELARRRQLWRRAHYLATHAEAVLWAAHR